MRTVSSGGAKIFSGVGPNPARLVGVGGIGGGAGEGAVVVGIVHLVH